MKVLLSKYFYNKLMRNVKGKRFLVIPAKRESSSQYFFQMGKRALFMLSNYPHYLLYFKEYLK